MWLVMVLCAGLIWVIAFDTLGSLSARHFGFRCAKLSIVQFLAYILVGAVAGLHASPMGAALVGGAIGLVESTVGWAISWYIGPGRVAGLSPAGAIRIAMILTAMAAAFAFVGALIMGPRWP